MSFAMRLLQVAALGCLALPARSVLPEPMTIRRRPVTLIVPFPPGGSTTVMARNVGDKMSAALGQQIVVDNRGGAGGTLGTRFVAKAAPDGYTILLSYTATMAIAPAMNANAGYDPAQGFRADRHDRFRAERPGGASVAAGAFDRRTDRHAKERPRRCNTGRPASARSIIWPSNILRPKRA